MASETTSTPPASSTKPGLRTRSERELVAEQEGMTTVLNDSKTFEIKDHLKSIKLRKGLVTTLIHGRENSLKILRYDMKALVTYSAWLTLLSHGTVFTMDNTALLNVFVMLIIAVIAGSITVCLSLPNLDKMAAIDLEPIKDLASQMNALVPFCLGLYVTLTLARWWTLREKALGQLFEAFSNTIMIVASELHEKKWTTLRNQVAKYGFASIELLIQAARGKDMSKDLDKLVGPGFLTHDECTVLIGVESWHRPLVIWAWILRICTSAMDHHKTPPARVNGVTMQCIRAREGMATINAYLDTQLPYAYVHLITLLVNVQNLVVSIKAGITVATAIPQRNYNLMGQQVVSLLIVVFIYQALLQITYMIMDPFGDDVLDFPIKAYTHYVANTIDAILEAQPECPVVAEDGSLHRPVLSDFAEDTDGGAFKGVMSLRESFEEED